MADATMRSLPDALSARDYRERHVFAYGLRYRTAQCCRLKEARVGIWIVQQWSVQEGDREACEKALAVISDHIRDEHPEIIGVRTYKQWVGGQPHRGFIWAEHSESLTAVEEGISTQTCVDVWKPIHAMAMPGTHIRSVWLDAVPTWER